MSDYWFHPATSSLDEMSQKVDLLALKSFLHICKGIYSMMDTDAHWMHESVVLCEMLYHLVIMLYNAGTNLTYSTEN